MFVQRSVRRAAAVSITSLALSCSGMAMAHADSGSGQGKPPSHSHAGGNKNPGNQGSQGHGGNPGHQGSQGHEGNPGHQGSKGGNQGTQPAPAQPAQPSQPSQDGQGTNPSQPTTPGDDVKGSGHNPPGNNGTIKIEQLQADGTPQNNPHQSCQLRVEWYGFDEGDDVVSEVSFAAIAPTAGSTVSTTDDTSVPVGGDAASGAGTDTGLDGSKVYTLSFTGTPHAQQGYHVKVTVHTPHSLGNDSKTKVFWMQPCTGEGSSPTGGTLPQPGAPAGGDGSVTEGGTVTGAGAGTGIGTEGGTLTGTGTDVTVSGAAPTDDGSVPVPTSVEAGSEGLGEVGDLLPLALLGLGAAMTAAAAYLRRRAARA